MAATKDAMKVMPQGSRKRQRRGKRDRGGIKAPSKKDQQQPQKVTGERDKEVVPKISQKG